MRAVPSVFPEDRRCTETTKVRPPMTQTASATSSFSSGASSFQDELRARLRDDQVDLPVLPAAAQEVLRMTSDPNTNGKALSAKISGDPALSAHVLRVANSALYAGGFTLTSIRQAVGRLGLELIGQIAASVAIQSSAMDNQRFQEELQTLWCHSLRRGLCARELARIRRDSIDQAFLGGLLRDLGQACVYRELDRLGQNAGELSFEECKALALALSHCAGAALAQKWELAPEIAAPMSTPFSLEAAEPSLLVIELADSFAQQLCGDEEACLSVLRAHPVSKRLDLPDESFAQLAKARERIEQSAQAMS